MNVLIIEDDPGAAAMLQARFEKIGMQVAVTDSFESAMKIIEAAVPKPEVITVDINLTDIQGEHTIARIHEIRAVCPDALILVISGVITPQDSARLAALGADASIEKLEITTEKTWWTRIMEALSGVATQAGLTRNLAHVRKLSERATERYNEIGASLRLTPPTENKKE